MTKPLSPNLSPNTSTKKRGLVEDFRSYLEKRASKIRRSVAKETVEIVDCSYIATTIDNWWREQKSKGTTTEVKIGQISALLQTKLQNEHKILFTKVGRAGNYLSGVVMTGLFTIENKELASIVHESLSNLFGLQDIKYPYEDHKMLYIKPEGLNYKEWGNGKGEITPHSDDLYEKIDTDLLALTVAIDKTKTPTQFFQAKDILRIINDQELQTLQQIEADFISGKNVSGLKTKTRKIVDYNSDDDETKIALDFRVDKNTGQRMIARLRSHQALLKKIEDGLTNCAHISSVPETGTFMIFANLKGLHARTEINLEESHIQGIVTDPVKYSPRTLFRSKGPIRDDDQANQGR